MAEYYSKDRRTRIRLSTWYLRFAWSTAGANIIVESWHPTWLGGAWDKVLVPELALQVSTWGKKDPGNTNEAESPGPGWSIFAAGAGFRQVNVGVTVPGVGAPVDVFAQGGSPRPDGTISLTRLVARGSALLRDGEELAVGPATARY